MAHVLERLHAAPAARAVDEAHQRHAQVVGRALGPDHLLPDGRVGGTAADGEVVALDDGAPPGDPALPDDHVGRQERLELAVAVVGAPARERAGLVERPGVEQARHALADREAAGRVLAGDALLAAHLLGELGPPSQLVELLLPGHRPGRYSSSSSDPW